MIVNLQNELANLSQTLLSETTFPRGERATSQKCPDLNEDIEAKQREIQSLKSQVGLGGKSGRRVTALRGSEEDCGSHPDVQGKGGQCLGWG